MDEQDDVRSIFEEMGNLTMMSIHLHEIYTALQEGGFTSAEALYIVTNMLTHDWDSANDESD